MMALDSVTAHPEMPASLKRGTTLPPFPKAIMRPGYDAVVMVAFVVDDRGRVVPASVFVMSSTDPILSRWACKIVPDIRFNPAEERGRAVASQTSLPFVLHGPPVKDSTG
jgi:outer membrane biosynthesis protein TonB